MKIEKRFVGSASFMATLCATLLAACGGGGSDSQPDPADKYLGTLVANCDYANASDATTNATLYRVDTLSSPVKVSATKVQYTTTVALYDKMDCSGTPRTTLTLGGSDNYINVDGATTIADKAVDKLTISVPVYFSGVSGTSVVINGIRYTPSYTSQTPTTEKNIAYVGADNKVSLGDFNKTLDANGYPTALWTTPYLTIKK